MDSTLVREDFLPGRPQGMGAGLALALLAHLLLIAALAFSVHWRASDPAGVEAELWAAVPQQAAPRAAEPEPVKPEPRPEPVRREPPPPPKPAEPPPAPRVNDAQIAIEKAQKAEKARREEAERLEETKREKARRDEAKRKDDLRKEDLRKEEARKEQREAERREAAAAREQEAQERKKKELQADAQRQAKALEAQREANLKRIAGMAGASGDERATGSALQSAGPSAGYAGRIRARIKPNIVFTDSSIPGNPVASVEVRVSPDGTITSRKIVKSSGVPAWDDAVLRAIDRTEVLPRDTDGRIPPAFALEFRPRD